MHFGSFHPRYKASATHGLTADHVMQHVTPSTLRALRVVLHNSQQFSQLCRSHRVQSTRAAPNRPQPVSLWSLQLSGVAQMKVLSYLETLFLRSPEPCQSAQRERNSSTLSTWQMMGDPGGNRSRSARGGPVEGKRRSRARRRPRRCGAMLIQSQASSACCTNLHPIKEFRFSFISLIKPSVVAHLKHA